MNLKQIKAKYNLAGVVTIAYDGSGDSGYIEQDGIGIEPERDITDALEDLQNFAYDLLEQKHGGWEINEGSCGKIVIDFKKNTLEIEHNERIQSYDTSTHREKF